MTLYVNEIIIIKEDRYSGDAIQTSTLHPTFCGQDFLDIHDRISYTFPHKKHVLIKTNLGMFDRPRGAKKNDEQHL
jgi:zona occludens toxin (predicted ATPase)